MDSRKHIILFGAGKSATVLADFARHAENGGCQDLLVFAPAGSYRNWFQDKGEDEENWSELRKHLNPGFRKRLVDVPWISGRATTGALKERIAAMLQCRDKKRPRALFMNIEALSTVSAAQELCTEFVDQRGAMIVVDESTTIRNIDSKRGQFLVKLGEQAHSKRIMSGLWTPRAPIDLFAQCQFLDPRILRVSNEWAFKARYAVMKRRLIVIPGQFNKDGSKKLRPFQEIVAWKNLEELQRRIAKYSYRVRAEDCLDLPEKMYVTRDVELTKEQRQMMQELRAFGHAVIGDSDRFVTPKIVIELIARMMQITCGFVMDDERVLREVPERKTDELVELLSEHVGKAVIWCPWKPPLFKIIRRLQKEFGPESVAQWHGGNTTTRDQEERRFINDPRCLYMCATQGAGMRGNTWVVPDLVVYYANNYDLEQRDQSERRTWRKGQTKKVKYVDLITEKTSNWSEWTIVRSLRKKMNIASMMNQEDVREWLIS